MGEQQASRLMMKPLRPQNQNLERSFAFDSAMTKLTSVQLSPHVITWVTSEILSWEANALQYQNSTFLKATEKIPE